MSWQFFLKLLPSLVRLLSPARFPRDFFSASQQFQDCLSAQQHKSSSIQLSSRKFLAVKCWNFCTAEKKINIYRKIYERGNFIFKEGRKARKYFSIFPVCHRDYCLSSGLCHSIPPDLVYITVDSDILTMSTRRNVKWKVDAREREIKKMATISFTFSICLNLALRYLIRKLFS